MNSQSHFSHHEPCKRCHSKDNFARYSDGHGFCFGCSFYEHGQRISRISDHNKEKLSTNNVDWGLHLTNNLPKNATLWLKRYGITDEEIQSYNMRYDTTRNWLCLP